MLAVAKKPLVDDIVHLYRFRDRRDRGIRRRH